MATGLADLPEDVLTIIFSYCQAKDFLAACCTCKTLYSYRQDAAFWRTLTSATFRLPVSPLLRADGPRWYYLYKRLKTQTRLYTWGQGLKGNLGPGRGPVIHRQRGRTLRSGVGRVMRQGAYNRASSSWPTETQLPDEVEVIADLQCGGWSTTILSSDGCLYVTGMLDAMDNNLVGESSEHFRKLDLPAQGTSAIRQFSSGRRHVLALSDDGEIISWDRINARGLKIFFRNEQTLGKKATRVVAGWAHSSAYVPEIGIIYWEPIQNNTNDEMLDGVHVAEVVIPGTAKIYTADHQPIEVVSHIVLDDFVVWVMSDSTICASEIRVGNPEHSSRITPPFEVPGYGSPTRTLQDIQGQYNKFAVFTDLGEVLAGNSDYLRLCANAVRSNPISQALVDAASAYPVPDQEQIAWSKPADIAALQNNHVISLAFGDHHYHALHADGRITSYGNDPQSVGALGLGQPEGGGRFRGLRGPNQGHFQRSDSKLLPQAEKRGRTIWFEPEKRDWLAWMEDTLKEGSDLGDVVNNEGTSVGPLYLWKFDSNKQLMFSEWVEQEGNSWDDGPMGIDLQDRPGKLDHQSHDDFHLDPYFTIQIAAAGWHSGALVLVDDDKVHDTRQKWLTTIPSTTSEEEGHGGTGSRYMPGTFETKPADPEETYVWKTHGFPKIVLPDGYEMPGRGEPRPWRHVKPTLAELEISN